MKPNTQHNYGNRKTMPNTRRSSVSNQLINNFFKQKKEWAFKDMLSGYLHEDCVDDEFILNLQNNLVFVRPLQAKSLDSLKKEKAS